MKEHVTIRHANRDDLHALEWDGEYTHFRRLYAQAFRRAEKGDAVLWVASLHSESLIGQLFVQLISNRTELADGVSRAYVYSFRVRPDYRDIGIGTLLFNTAENDLKNRGFRHITLNVGKENADARRFYERFGYRVIAAEPGIWSYVDHNGHQRQVREPSWRMEKALISEID